MSKKEEFTGVDEKYIPKNEVNEKSESKNSDKTVKNIAIGYIIFLVILFGLIIASFIGIGFFAFSTFNKFNAVKDNMLSEFEEKGSAMVDKFNSKENSIDVKKNEDEISKREEEVLKKEKEMEALSFNSSIKSMQGTQSKFVLSNYLDEVVTKNKTNSKHSITVIYKEITASSEDDIIRIKHSLNEDNKYEVSVDYDSDGFINKITIKDIVK